MKAQELSSLASIVYNVWYFFTHGHSPDMVLFCKTQGKEMQARDMFFRNGQYVFVHPNALPLDPNVKAICVNYGHPAGGRLYFETTFIDWDLLGEKMAEWKYGDRGLAIKGKQFTWNGTPAIATSSRQHFGKRTSPRTVFNSICGLASVPVEALVLVADLVFEHGCFAEFAIPKVNEESADDDVALPERTAMEMHMQMSQQMRMMIAREQVPLQIMQMRHCAFVAHRGRILRMNGQQLERHVKEAVRKNPVLKIK